MKNTLAAAIMCLVIGGMLGWFVNGWRLSAKFGRAQVAAIEQLEAINAERRAEWERQAESDRLLKLRLAKKLRDSRLVADDLRTQIDSIDLSTPAPELETLSECPSREEIKIVIDNHNPFNRDFVRLWNASARGTSPGADSAAETNGSD